MPSEYLNPRHVPLLLPRLIPSKADSAIITADLSTYLSALGRVRTTDDRMFGIKVHVAQLVHHIGRDIDRIMSFVEGFDRIILMTRRDKLGQAISLSISEATQTWFNDGGEPLLTAPQRRRLIPEIALNLTRCIDEERLMLEVGRRFGRPLVRIDYEEVAADGEAIFRDAADFLSGGRAGNIVEDSSFPVPRKPAGLVSDAVREEFLASIQGNGTG